MDYNKEQETQEKEENSENLESNFFPGVVEVVVDEIGAESSGIQDGSQQSSGFQDGSQQSSGFQDELYGTNFGVPIVLEDVVGNTGFEDQSFENSWIEDERFENTGLGEDETTGPTAVEDSEIFYQNFAIRDFLKTFFFMILDSLLLLNRETIIKNN